VGYAIVKDGVIAAESYSELFEMKQNFTIAHPSPRHWRAGRLEKMGKLDITWSLGVVFVNETEWVGVEPVEEIKRLTIRDSRYIAIVFRSI